MYDVIIIGGGPAGLAAGIYSARYNLKTLIVYDELGGAINYAHIVENYPGFESVSGMELVKKFEEHAKSLGAEFEKGEVVGVRKEKDGFVVNLKKGELKSKVLILALGTKRRKLNIPGEGEYIGKGVSYCATCDGPLYKGKTVAVAGKGGSARNAVEFLNKFAKKVHSVDGVKGIRGKKVIEEIVLEDGKVLKVDGLFIEIGNTPSVSIAKSLGVKLDGEGYIVTGKNQETNVTGVFAAGDVTNCSLKQLTIAVGQGSLAAFSAYNHLKK